MTDVVWTRDALIANAESLLAIDAKGALTPHGIGHLAREIITGFLDLVRDADPLPDADGWIKHTPGPCPVPGSLFVQVKCPAFDARKLRADYFTQCEEDWWENGRITHYRIVRSAPSGPVVEETDPVRNFVADGFDAGLLTFRILRDLGAMRGRPFSDEYIVMAVLQDAEKAAAVRKLLSALEPIHE